jgi:dephospho-CoA kinase
MICNAVRLSFFSFLIILSSLKSGCMVLPIGLTGGIGSGKSTVAAIFEVLGIPVYYADEAARKIMNEDPELKASIIRHFSERSYKDGKLDRNYLGRLVFGNREKLRLLDSLVHPATIKDGDEWMRKQTTAYAVKEAALIFESGVNKHLDYIVGVYAPKSLRIRRTMERDHISEEEVLKRMRNQMNEEEKMKLCDFVIHNDEQQAVLPQVMELHQQLLKLAKK